MGALAIQYKFEETIRMAPSANPSSWDLTPSEAIELQKQLRRQIEITPYEGPIQYIGGADISFNKYSPTVFAGFVVLDAKTLEVVDSASAVLDVSFPYIPGLLSFREIPPLLQAWKGLRIKPDVMVFDGQGIAHPRRLGIASHAGLILDLPSIGCAKSLLTGVYKEPAIEAGSLSPLLDRSNKEHIGVVYRTKKNVKPVFVSPGHKIDFITALDILQICVGHYRIPEPTRQAHLFVNEVRLSYLEGNSSSAQEFVNFGANPS